jgi:hypothetical protein
MVNFNGLMPHTVVDGVVVYDITKCYAIPVRYFFYHYMMKNLKTTCELEQMHFSNKVTFRFCREMLTDFYHWVHGNKQLKMVDWAIYDTVDKCWYSIMVRGDEYHLVINDERRILKRFDIYDMRNNFKARCDAVEEYQVNDSYFSVCKNYVPLVPHSLAPYHGEINAILR